MTQLLRAAFVLTSFLAAAVQAQQFPEGTLRFFGTGAEFGIPAAGGGVWVVTPEGIVRYTTAGKGAVLKPAGGPVRHLEGAADGSIWFANSGLGRISATGTLVEHYARNVAYDLEEATDGALWHLRQFSTTVTRIAGGVPAEHDAGMDVWSFAPAAGGSMWVLESGFGTDPQNLRLMAPTGAVTVLPLSIDVLAGKLQALPDGTLYIGGGLRRALWRFDPGTQVLQRIDGFRDIEWVADSSGNVWSGNFGRLSFIGASGTPRFDLPMPLDPRTCEDRIYYFYHPIAVDSEGGLWVQVLHDRLVPGSYPRCNEPAPPPLPDLIRIDPAAVLAAHNATDIPVLSPAMIAALILAVGAVAVLKLRAG